MNINSLRTLVLSAAAAAMVVVAASPAEAGRRHHNNAGPAIVAGVMGLAAGAMIAGAMSRPSYGYYEYRTAPRTYYVPRERVYVPRERVYVEPRYYEEPSVVYYRDRPRTYRTNDARAEPWTREWFRSCKARYRSFDPDSGTYKGYDGRRHFCN
ncbi:MAG: BA14K family protein [Hyphomicrobiales bacterium]